jgi:hypothetical protein
MTDDPIYAIFRKLNDISGIVNELPTIGKRSELGEKAYEIAALIAEAGKPRWIWKKR